MCTAMAIFVDSWNSIQLMFQSLTHACLSDRGESGKKEQEFTSDAILLRSEGVNPQREIPAGARFG
jgi:hypothetical protein